uniref:Uncharacterized protein n=1 Tax=Anguilla anguilla TaxID=7936 RepID=A0A0E9UVB4_ANGAN
MSPSGLYLKAPTKAS